MSAQHANLCSPSSRFTRLLAAIVLAAGLAMCAQPPALQATSTTQPWQPPVTVDRGSGIVGTRNAMGIVDGYPAIAYYDETNDVPRYVRATDADGTAWGEPVMIDDPGGVPGAGSLAVVAGHPSISYITANTLKYVRSLDTAGLAWGEPVAVTALVGPTEFSLAVVDGNPAIAYFAGNKSMYVRATAADGAAWGEPVVIDEDAPFSSYGTVSLLVVAGRPAVAYTYAGYTDAGMQTFALYYVRAADAGGAVWFPPITVSESEFALIDSSLAVVNGRPALSFNTRGGQLGYVRASDSRGDAWAAPRFLEDRGASFFALGDFNRLAVVDGSPAISYQVVENIGPKRIVARFNMCTPRMRMGTLGAPRWLWTGIGVQRTACWW